MFKGFNFELPVYYVLTPQTGSGYHIRSLTVAEVSKLKTSLVSPNTAHKILNEIIWKAIDDKPEGMGFEDFKKNVTILDREALLYGLYHTTFGDIKEYAVSCSNCDETQLINVSLDASFSMNAYPYSEAAKKSYKVAKAIDEDSAKDAVIEEALVVEDKLKEVKKNEVESVIDDGSTPEPKSFNPDELEKIANKKKKKDLEDKSKQFVDVLTKRVSVLLPISKVVAVIKQPTIYDEEFLMSSIPFTTKKQNDLVGETLVIERFEQYKEGHTTPYELVTDREDILRGYQSLPPRDKTAIYESYNDNFGQYNISLKTNYECRKCGVPNELDLSIAVQLFRMVNVS
jgi:hypothetical protein